MDDLVSPEHDAPVRLTDDQAQQLVLRTVTTQAESLLRTAHRHSLCADDAQDAYQRGMEIFMRRAATLDPERAGRWLHVVVKREAWAVRAARADVAASATDFEPERHEAVHAASPEEQALSAERVTRAAEALQRLKPQEVKAMWLRATGASYAEIAEATGFSATKVNRCLAEGRKSFLERYAGIESGEECARWRPLLSAIVDGEATAAQMAEVRPHLRNCSACRATLRGLHDAERALAVVMPLGLAGVSARLSGLLEHLLPAAPADGVVASGGLGLFGAGGVKLAGLLAAGAVATAGGGLAAVHEHRHPGQRATAAHIATAPAPTGTTTISASSRLVPRTAVPARIIAERPARLTARRVPGRKPPSHHALRVEFRPVGSEPVVAAARTPTALARAAQDAQELHVNSRPEGAGSPADSSRGEFAPHS